jgi:hypothetical protein
VRSWPHHSKLLHRALQARSYFVRDSRLRMNVGRNAEDKNKKNPEIAFERAVASHTPMASNSGSPARFFAPIFFMIMNMNSVALATRSVLKLGPIFQKQ